MGNQLSESRRSVLLNMCSDLGSTGYPWDSSFQRRLQRTSALLDTFDLPIFQQSSKAGERSLRHLT